MKAIIILCDELPDLPEPDRTFYITGDASDTSYIDYKSAKDYLVEFCEKSCSRGILLGDVFVPPHKISHIEVENG